MYVFSLELGLPPPLHLASVPLPPEPKGGDTLACGWGVGESQFQRLEKRLALCLLCGTYNPVHNIFKTKNYAKCASRVI